MQQESSSSPGFIDRAATALDHALARIVARVREEFASDRRAMDAEIRAARAELIVARAELDQMLDKASRTVAELERTTRGEPGPAGERGAQGERGEQGERGPQGEAGPPGERGADGAPGRDGAAGERGPPGERGADGVAGRDGRDGLPGLAGEPGQDGFHGRDGADGKDGLGFDELVQFDEGLDFGIRASRGGVMIKEFRWARPTLADFHCGPFKAGTAYQRGQCVTHGGSTFLCLRDTEQRPETDDWRLIVKHGTSGRSGKDGERGVPGPTGRDGRDLTQLSPGGLKYG